MRRPRPEPPTLERMRYAPPGAYRLDLEVMTMTELRRRAPRERLRAPHRLDFIALIGVTRGRCRHFVDFVPYECRAGSWVVVRPGQVHRYDTTSAWDGYQVVFRPEFLLPLQQGAAPIDSAVYASLEGLPTQVTFERAQSRAALACVVQMSLDATAGVAEGLRHPLLRHQLYSLVLRLLAASERSPPEREPASVQVQRFKRFRQAVERDFARTHRVTDYARRLGYAEKTLT
ncbi:MAG: AraC family ligand binding domain-containing protein, partial [Burkholderiales bacterium]